MIETQTVYYSCGCSASGKPPLPTYCASHEAPEEECLYDSAFVCPTCEKTTAPGIVNVPIGPEMIRVMIKQELEKLFPVCDYDLHNKPIYTTMELEMLRSMIQHEWKNSNMKLAMQHINQRLDALEGWVRSQQVVFGPIFKG